MDRLAYGTVCIYHSTDRVLDHAPVYESSSVKGSRFRAANCGIDVAEYWLPSPTTKHGKAVAEPDSKYHAPRGCRMLWRVLSNEPFRHLCIAYPNPSQKSAAARSVAARQS
jgi:hypothetical protein